MLPSNTFGMLARGGYGLWRTHNSQVIAFSSKAISQVVVADDGRTLVCWHPEPEFPYEHSLPLPSNKEIVSSVIKSINSNDDRDVSHLSDVKEQFAREQLMKMTFTTKHRWFPHLQKKKAKKTPMHRPYL